jgi:hypothetical protein
VRALIDCWADVESLYAAPKPHPDSVQAQAA